MIITFELFFIAFDIVAVYSVICRLSFAHLRCWCSYASRYDAVELFLAEMLCAMKICVG